MPTELFIIKNTLNKDILGVFSCEKQAYISYAKVWWNEYNGQYCEGNEKIGEMLKNPFLYSKKEWENVIKESTPFYDSMVILPYELDEYYY